MKKIWLSLLFLSTGLVITHNINCCNPAALEEEKEKLSKKIPLSCMQTMIVNSPDLLHYAGVVSAATGAIKLCNWAILSYCLGSNRKFENNGLQYAALGGVLLYLGCWAEFSHQRIAKQLDFGEKGWVPKQYPNTQEFLKAGKNALIENKRNFKVGASNNEYSTKEYYMQHPVVEQVIADTFCPPSLKECCDLMLRRYSRDDC